VLLTANYFDNDFSDLIDFDPELFVNVNRSEVSIQGVELSVDWSITEQIGFTAQGTNLDIDTGSSEVILTGRPEWSGSALVSYDYSPQLSMAANYIWNRDSFGASLHTGMTLLEELDSVQRLDMNIVWRPSSKLDLTAALNNVFDRENSEAVGFPSPGRWFRVVAKYKI